MLDVDRKNHQILERCHGDLRNGVYESTYLNYFSTNSLNMILNSRIKDKHGIKYLDIESVNVSDDFTTCMKKNYSIFEKELEVAINYIMKLDMVNESYTIQSSYGSKSMMLSPDRLSVLAMYYDSFNDNYQYFSSFQRDNDLITLIANTDNNEHAVVYVEDENKIYKLDRLIGSNEIQEITHRVLTNTIMGVSDGTKIKSIRVEVIQRTYYNEQG